MKQERQRSHSDSNEVFCANRNSVIVHTRQRQAAVRPSSRSSLDGLMLLAQQAELAQGTQKIIDSTSLAVETSRLQLGSLRQSQFDINNNVNASRSVNSFNFNDYSATKKVPSRLLPSRLLQRSLSDNSVANRSFTTQNSNFERQQRPNDFLPSLHHEFATSALLPSPNRAFQWSNWDCVTSKSQTNKTGNSPLENGVTKASSHDSGISLASGSGEDLPETEVRNKNSKKDDNITNTSLQTSENDLLSRSFNSIFPSSPLCQTPTVPFTWSSLLDDTQANNKAHSTNDYGEVCEPWWRGIVNSTDSNTELRKTAAEIAQAMPYGMVYNAIYAKQNNQGFTNCWKNSINDFQPHFIEKQSEKYGLEITNRNIGLQKEMCQVSTRWPLRVSVKEQVMCQANGLGIPQIKHSQIANRSEMLKNRNKSKGESVSSESDDENTNNNESIDDDDTAAQTIKNTKYFCEFCKKPYNNNETFTRHMMTHNGRRTHRCDHCSRSFYDEVSFMRHSRSHSGEKAHKCTHCSMAFGKRSALKVHLRTHTGERPYECQHCGKGFSISGNLHRHLLIHSGLRPYKCGKCPKAFNNPSHLARHISSIHTVEKSDDV